MFWVGEKAKAILRTNALAGNKGAGRDQRENGVDGVLPSHDFVQG